MVKNRRGKISIVTANIKGRKVKYKRMFTSIKRGEEDVKRLKNSKIYKFTNIKLEKGGYNRK